MRSNLVEFIQVLRTHDVRVSPAETLDAVDVAASLGYADRSLLRDGLAMTLAKTVEEEAIFLQCFDRFFRAELADFALEDPDDKRSAGDQPDDSGSTEGDGAPRGLSAAALTEALQLAAGDSHALGQLLQTDIMRNLLANDREALTLAIKRAADSTGLKNIEMFTQKGQYTRRILNELGEEHIRGTVAELEDRQSPALAILMRYRDVLREQVRGHVDREYLLRAAGRNREFLDDILAKTRLSAIEHIYLHRAQEIIRKMARKLASRHARRRRRLRRGQLDMPKTLRRGVANDGVRFDTYWRYAMSVGRSRPMPDFCCCFSTACRMYCRACAASPSPATSAKSATAFPTIPWSAPSSW